MAPENKIGIISSPELAEAEERISKKKAAELLKTAYWTVWRPVRLRP